MRERDATKVTKVNYDALILMVAITLVNPGQDQNRIKWEEHILMIHSMLILS